MKKYVYGFNYNLPHEKATKELTTISIPAINEEQAQQQLTLIFGGKSHSESMCKRVGGIFLVDEAEY